MRQNSGYSERSVAPHATYNERLLTIKSAGVDSKADVRLVARSTFHEERF